MKSLSFAPNGIEIEPKQPNGPKPQTIICTLWNKTKSIVHHKKLIGGFIPKISKLSILKNKPHACQACSKYNLAPT